VNLFCTEFEPYRLYLIHYSSLGLFSGFVSKTLEKIAKEEALKKRSTMTDDVIFDYGSINNNNPNYVKLSAPPTPLLKLKIRNITKYLNWRLSILKRDNFTCKICHTSVKDNKHLRLEVHHAKAFDDICKENSVSMVEQALACKELWDLNNGFSMCCRCHKDIETVTTKLRNV
jgi:predicted PP-loop superfamily ATPase